MSLPFHNYFCSSKCEESYFALLFKFNHPWSHKYRAFSSSNKFKCPSKSLLPWSPVRTDKCSSSPMSSHFFTYDIIYSLLVLLVQRCCHLMYIHPRFSCAMILCPRRILFNMQLECNECVYRHGLIEATKMKFDIEERGGDNMITNINRTFKHTYTHNFYTHDVVKYI